MGLVREFHPQLTGSRAARYPAVLWLMAQVGNWASGPTQAKVLTGITGPTSNLASYFLKRAGCAFLLRDAAALSVWNEHRLGRVALALSRAHTRRSDLEQLLEDCPLLLPK